MGTVAFMYVMHAPQGFAELVYPWFTVVSLMFGLIWLAARSLSTSIQMRVSSFLQKRSTMLGSGLGFGVLYLVSGFIVLSFPGYIDPNEPMIAAASYSLLAHRSVYAMLIPYGPYCFIPYAAAMWASGSAIWGGKFFVLAMNVLLVWFLWSICRKFVPAHAACLCVGVTLAGLLLKQSYLFQLRGDIILFVAVAAGLWAGLCRSRGWAAVLMSLAITIAIGVKITAVFYICFSLVVFARKYGAKLTAFVVFVAFTLSLLPFAFQSLTLVQYAFWLRAMSHEARSGKELLGNIVTAAIVLVPPVFVGVRLRKHDPLALKAWIRHHWPEAATFVSCVVIVVLLGGKVGGGRHHLSPMVISSLFISLELYRSHWYKENKESLGQPLCFGEVLCWGCLGILLAMSAGSELYDLAQLSHREYADAQALKQDIHGIAMTVKAPKRIELGDGEGEFELDRHYSPMYGAPEILLRGGQYVFDPSAEADRELMHLPLSPTSLNRVQDCNTVWLIPRGEIPFRTFSIYSGMYPKRFPAHILFGDDVRRAFSAIYNKVGSSRFYDIYSCTN